MIATGAIVAGYALLIWQFGWLGVAAAALHVAVMVAALYRR